MAQPAQDTRVIEANTGIGARFKMASDVNGPTDESGQM